MKKYQKKLQVGSLDSKAKAAAAPPTPPATPPPAAEKEEIVKPSAEPGVVAPVPAKGAAEEVEMLDSFGELVSISPQETMNCDVNSFVGRFPEVTPTGTNL